MKKTTQGISLLEAIDQIRSGVPFSATFVKRTTGKHRHIVAVKKQSTTGKNSQPYSFRKKNLIPVYDLQSNSYKSIPINSLMDVNGSKIMF